MKKATMQTILSLISTIESPKADAVREELTAELNKDAERKAQNADLYETAKGIVLKELGETPVTIGELYDALKAKLPEDFTKGKLQYAMTRLWTSEIRNIKGKVNTYCVA